MVRKNRMNESLDSDFYNNYGARFIKEIISYETDINSLFNTIEGLVLEAAFEHEVPNESWSVSIISDNDISFNSDYLASYGDSLHFKVDFDVFDNHCGIYVRDGNGKRIAFYTDGSRFKKFIDGLLKYISGKIYN